MIKLEKSDVSTASYYELPEGVTELQNLISHRNMNAFIGFIFIKCYDYTLSGSRDIQTIREILRHAELELERVQNVQGN